MLDPGRQERANPGRRHLQLIIWCPGGMRRGSHGERCLGRAQQRRALGLREGQLADTYYTTLLRFVGCTSDSHELMAFAAGEDVRFRQLMVAIGNDTPDEMAPHLAQFMAAVGAGGDIPARVREALESPDGIGAQIAAVHCEVATMLAARLGLGSTVCDALRHAFAALKEAAAAAQLKPVPPVEANENAPARKAAPRRGGK